MLPTVRRYTFLFNNQPDALFIQIYSVIKLYMFQATSLPIIRSLLLQSRDGTGTAVPVTSWLCLEAVIITCMKLNSAECTVGDS